MGVRGRVGSWCPLHSGTRTKNAPGVAPRGVAFHQPDLASLFPAASLARFRWVADRRRGAGGASADGVSAATNRATAGRLVNQRPPTRTASNFTSPPAGVFAPFVTHRKTVDG